MRKFHDIIKKYKISLKLLSNDMNYTVTYISQILNGKRATSAKFEKLLILALKNYLICYEEDLNSLLSSHETNDRPIKLLSD